MSLCASSAASMYVLATRARPGSPDRATLGKSEGEREGVREGADGGEGELSRN